MLAYNGKTSCFKFPFLLHLRVYLLIRSNPVHVSHLDAFHYFQWVLDIEKTKKKQMTTLLTALIAIGFQCNSWSICTEVVSCRDCILIIFLWNNCAFLIILNK